MMRVRYMATLTTASIMGAILIGACTPNTTQNTAQTDTGTTQAQVDPCAAANPCAGANPCAAKENPCAGANPCAGKVEESFMPTASDGVPAGFTEQEWLAVDGDIWVSDSTADSYTITVEATGLVPNGLYTFWWVSDALVGVSMGPAGGTPENEFRADSEGNVTTSITVPADNNYETLIAAYHADDQTHGDRPGAMGEVTFGHFMGKFPQPN